MLKTIPNVIEVVSTAPGKSKEITGRVRICLKQIAHYSFMDGHEIPVLLS